MNEVLQFNTREHDLQVVEGKLKDQQSKIIEFYELPLFKVFFHDALGREIETLTESILSIDDEGDKKYTKHDVDRKVLRILKQLQNEPKILLVANQLSHLLHT